MVQDYETFREVGIGISGVRTLMAWQGVVFAAVVAFAAGGYSLLFTRVGNLDVAVGRVEERLISIDATLKQIAGDMSATRSGVSDVQKKMADADFMNSPLLSEGTKVLIGKLAGSIELAQPGGLAANVESVQRSISMLPGDLQANVKTDCGNAINAKATLEYASMVVCAAATSQ